MTAVVVGGGVAGLVVARELARNGTRVVLLERADRLGGRVRGAAFAGTTIDVGAESFATRGGGVAALLGELGLAGEIADPSGAAWVALPGGAVPLPAGGLLGIPGNPLAPDVRLALGTSGAYRAYADRVVPLLRVRGDDRLGTLVRRRMGDRVLDRLVAPVVEAVYGADPDAVTVETIAPGLTKALSTAGSLSLAVTRLRAAAPAGAAAQGIVGGVHRLVSALATELDRLGVEVRLGAEVIGVHPAPHGPGFTVVTPAEDVVAARVVLAADGGTALDLLRDAARDVAALSRPAPAASRAVLLAVDDAALDEAPRGTGVLRAPASTGITAVALTHLTAKWPWLRERMPPHRHLLRLAYRDDRGVDDATVLRDARGLLGRAIADPVERLDTVWIDSAPPLDPNTVAIRAALAAAPLPDGLSVVGSWTAGTGLASVVADSRRIVA